jgi:hypothetical protein
MERVPLPVHLQGVFFDWRWETTKAWCLPTPVSSLPFEDLAWHLDLTVWSTVKGEPRFDLAPSRVLATPGSHARHWAKIQQVDASYALELFQNVGRWVILDGYHRLCRHYLSRTRQVPVRLHPAAFRELVEARGGRAQQPGPGRYLPGVVRRRPHDPAGEGPGVHAFDASTCVQADSALPRPPTVFQPPLAPPPGAPPAPPVVRPVAPPRPPR